MKTLRIILLALLASYTLALAAVSATAFLAPQRAELPPQSAIIVLGGPELWERTDRGIQLLQSTFDAKLVVTSHNVAKYMAKRAEREGIPSNAIFTEMEARSILQNAFFSRKELGDFDGTAVLVTQRSQLLRAALSFYWVGFDDIALAPSDTPKDYTFRTSGVLLLEASKLLINLVRAGGSSLLQSVGIPIERFIPLLN